MSMYVTSNMDDYEAAMRYDRAKGAFLAATMDDSRKALCDGNSHYAFYIDIDGSLGVCYIQSRQDILNGEYPDEVGLWFDDEGRAPRGYLPCKTWDAYYSPSDPDLHDRHASILMEISEKDFNEMKAAGWQIERLLTQHYFVDLFNIYVGEMNAAQQRLNAWEASYKDGAA